MKTIKKITSILVLASLLMLSGCSSDSDLAAVISADDNLSVLISPDDNTTVIVTASDYVMTLDVNKTLVSSNWKVDANTTGVSATVTTQGLYGTCTLNDTSITYTKTSESNVTDSCIVSIDNSVNITVSINILYWKQFSGGSYHTVAIKSDGTLWAWGLNDEGQLGNDSTTQSFIPVQENNKSTHWSSVSAGHKYTVAIKDDGTIWSWGSNSNGQLGDNSINQSLIAVQENSSTTSWSSVSAGGAHTVAIKTDGTLWAWGFNGFGRLGNNSINQSLIAVQENSSATNWSSVSAGFDHTVAIKSDGTLWSWGRNSNGQLGNNSTDYKLKPTREYNFNTNWSGVSAGTNYTVAIKSDGTIWAWGLNDEGQLGNNSTVQSLIAVQENSSTTSWSSVSAGDTHTVAIKTDGTLWAWGKNTYGQLGDGTVSRRLIPIQEKSSATNWSSISTGGTHSLAIQSDGAFLVWGENTWGQLGNNSTIESLIPMLPIKRK